MAEIVNLRMARKRKARDAREKTAQENRVRHGLDKAARVTLASERERDADALDGHRLQTREQDDDL